MDVNTAIREGIVSALSGNVTYKSKTVPIYDSYAIPNAVKYPYILVGSQTSSQVNTKGNRPIRATVVLDVVTGFLSPEGRKASETIFESANALINSDTRVDMDIESMGWRILDTNLISNGDLAARNQVYYVFRKLGTYTFILTKV